jgi:hypothetical protein
MSNFYCEVCGAVISDSERGYVTGCEHYPLEDTRTARHKKKSTKKPFQVRAIMTRNIDRYDGLMYRMFGSEGGIFVGNYKSREIAQQAIESVKHQYFYRDCDFVIVEK